MTFEARLILGQIRFPKRPQKRISMLSAFKHSLVLTAFAVVLAGGLVDADDAQPKDPQLHDFKLSEVPANVRELADKMAPKGEWTNISEARSDYGPVYLLGGKDSKGRWVGITIYGYGKVIRFDTTIGEVDLPEAVKKSIDKFAPKAKLEQSLRQVEGDRTKFSLEGKREDGRRIRLTVDPDGMISQSDIEIDPKEIPENLLKTILSTPGIKGSRIVHCWKINKKNDRPAGFSVDLIGADGRTISAHAAASL